MATIATTTARDTNRLLFFSIISINSLMYLNECLSLIIRTSKRSTTTTKRKEKENQQRFVRNGFIEKKYH